MSKVSKSGVTIAALSLAVTTTAMAQTILKPGQTDAEETAKTTTRTGASEPGIKEALKPVPESLSTSKTPTISDKKLKELDLSRGGTAAAGAGGGGGYGGGAPGSDRAKGGGAYGGAGGGAAQKLIIDKDRDPNGTLPDSATDSN